MVFTLQMNLKRKNVKKEKRNKKTNLRRIQGTFCKNETKTGYVPPRKIRREEIKKQKKIEKKINKKIKNTKPEEMEIEM